MRSSRWRAGLASAVALVVVAPAVASWTASSVSSSAVSSQLPCGSASGSLPWQSTPVPAFPGVDGVTTTDRVATYGIQSDTAARQITTNGVSVQSSTSNGCSWKDSYTLTAAPGPGGISGTTSRIVHSVLLKGGRGLLVLREGTAAASRTRVLTSGDGTGGTWAATENGLPAQGSPGVLTASDNGRTVYLTINPGGGGPDDGGGGGVPPLPPIGGGGGGVGVGAPGLVYASDDGGRTWSIRTAAGDLPGGDRAITALAVDRGNDDIVYAVATGQLLRSTDGARTFRSVTGATGVRAVVAMQPSAVAAVVSGAVLFSADSFASSSRQAAPGGITSAAYRAGDRYLAVEASGSISLLDPRSGDLRPAAAATPPRAGTMGADQGRQSTFHAIAGHALIRYVDPKAPDAPDVDVELPEGAPPPKPPKPGTLTPPKAQLELEEGDSRTVSYTLALPANPTPLDVMYLVDVSPTMSQYIKDLQQRITDISTALVNRGVDLNTGVSFLTTGPAEGDPPYQEIDNNCGGKPYVKPEVYKLLRKVGPPNADFAAAVGRLALRCVPSQAGATKPRTPPFDAAEAQVLALKELVTGEPVTLADTRGAFSVPGNQDAGWRQDRFVRKVIVHATDQEFINTQGEWPAGSPEVNGQLDLLGTAALMKAQGILHFGVDPGGRQDARPDLETMSRATGTFAPAGGAVCDPKAGARGRIAEGQPLVCGEASDFGDALISVLRSLADTQDVTLRTTTGSAAVSAISAGGLKGVNVTADNRLTFQVTYSCATIPPGKYLTTLETRLRGAKVASATTNLTCLKAQTTRPIRPVVEQEPPPPAPPQPAQPGVPPPAPPAPAAQPQVQPQPQVQIQTQINPMSAAALEQQEQLQLALALNGTEDRPGGGTELAMVDRRSREETSAQVLLLASMAAASLAGVARLRRDRTAHASAVRPARARSSR